MAFGLNNWGQLGKGYRSEEVVEPARITFFDDKTIVQMALSQHATAVLVDDGSV
jgi:singapore isolate B (sub-type 7) whole genome shotgun sequence assembly, scaffold_2